MCTTGDHVMLQPDRSEACLRCGQQFSLNHFEEMYMTYLHSPHID